MAKSLIILGRQPALGLAELESLFGADKLQTVSKQVVIVDMDPSDINIDRLGGTIKVCKVLTQLDTTDWHKLTDYLVEHVPKHTCCIGPGKLIFGISVYGLKVGQKSIERTGLEVKKAVRNSDGRPVRVVPTKGTELSTPQILHNKMFQAPLGMELVFVADGNKTWLCQTTGIQNIDAYTARDQARPKRDSKVGMLPPKLAQIIINLAMAEVIFTKNRTINAHDESYELPFDICDPFCGTGVLLQEALLMGYSVLGGDNDPRMVSYSSENLDWIAGKAHIEDPIYEVYLADATDPDSGIGGARAIACETYLGRPFSSAPDGSTLHQVMNDVNTIHKKFLQNIANQTKPGFRMCIAVPAWFRPMHRSSLPRSGATGAARASGPRNRFSAPVLSRSSIPTTSSVPHRENSSGSQMHDAEILHLPVLDHLTDMGYTRVSFVHAANNELIYHREGQIVGRELVVLTRK